MSQWGQIHPWFGLTVFLDRYECTVVCFFTSHSLCSLFFFHTHLSSLHVLALQSYWSSWKSERQCTLWREGNFLRSMLKSSRDSPFKSQYSVDSSIHHLGNCYRLSSYVLLFSYIKITYRIILAYLVIHSFNHHSLGVKQTFKM